MWSFKLQYGLAIDMKGNMAIQLSRSGGVSTGGELFLSKYVLRSKNHET